MNRSTDFMSLLHNWIVVCDGPFHWFYEFIAELGSLQKNAAGNLKPFYTILRSLETHCILWRQASYGYKERTMVRS